MRPFDLCLIRPHARLGDPSVRLGVPLLDEYPRFLAGRCRPNTVLAAAYDLKVFFTVVGKEPQDVQSADVLAFVSAQRSGLVSIGAVVQPVGDDQSGVSLRTVRRRLSSVSGCTRSCTPAAMCRRTRCRVGCRPAGNGSDRIRACHSRGVRTLPRILTPAEVDALTAAPRTHRDRAMVAAMVLGGLRRGEVLGLRLDDLRVAERRVFIAEGKGRHLRLVPVSRRFFDHVAAYLESERPAAP